MKVLYWIISRPEKAWTIYQISEAGSNWTAAVAIIKNATSNKMGRKDIIKVECPIDMLNLDILGFIDHNITVNIIKDGKIVAKRESDTFLRRSVNVILTCKNPRCITSIEQGLDHDLRTLTDPDEEVYRCKYCEQKYDSEF